ncbi:MAG: hypothetical protein KC483_06005 [Nitrosarchaeum sp.]|nr:hypothetical protein [Nitrosarchaeum sp.]
MSLEIQVKQILDDFENTSSEKITDALDEIKNLFKSDITQEYLIGKIKSVRDTQEESERKKLCKALVPYLDWYLQGT